MKRFMPFTRRLAISGLLLLPAIAPGGAQTNNRAESTPASKPDPWKPMRVFLGEWTGDVSGEPGTGKSEREYKFVLHERFIHVANKSTYPAQPKNLKGEVHEDTGFISYDKAAKKFVLRQFHTEGFVNQFMVETISADQRAFVFVSTAIENIPAGWRARESCKFTGENEFTETFELAEPGKDFAVYSETKFRRKQ